MRGHALHITLGVALLASLGLNWSVREPRAYRNVDFFPDMARTVRYNAFEPNPNFPDGATLRLPVPGTIPRGQLPLPPPAEGEGASLTNPFSPDDRAALERGAVVFENFCQPCHGPKGGGNGLVVQHGFPNPPTLLRARTRQMQDDVIFRLLTTGRGNMASYASQLSREDRWKVILFVRALQQASADTR